MRYKTLIDRVAATGDFIKTRLGKKAHYVLIVFRENSTGAEQETTFKSDLSTEQEKEVLKQVLKHLEGKIDAAN